MCTALVLLLVSIAFWTQAIWALALYQSLTPVYQELDCSLVNPKVTDFSLNLLNFWVDLETGTACYNPNSYSLTMESVGPMNVYMGDGFEKVATVEDIEKSVLDADSKGGITANVHIQPTSSTWGAVSEAVEDAIAGRETPIYLGMNIGLDVNVDLIFGKMQIQKTFDRKCGFNIKTHFFKVLVGPMACAEKWELINLPPVSNEPFDGKLDLDAEKLAPEEIEKGETLKNWGLGAAMGTGFFFGILFLTFSLYCVYRAYRAVKRLEPSISARNLEMRANQGNEPPTLINRKQSQEEDKIGSKGSKVAIEESNEEELA